ncbi:MAG: ribosome silencing factor [Bacteroidales bacterium]|nr:ribosome silencing factor [Bacteroidales bacterium]
MSKRFSKEENEELKKAIIEAIENKKGENIAVIEIGKIENAITDYFIICNANSNTQVNAIADGIEKDVRKQLKQKPWQTEGRDNSQWIVLDYVSIIVHVFQTPYRHFYQLEELWADAPIQHINSIY